MASKYRPYKFPTNEGALSWVDMKKLLNDASMVVLNEEINTVRALLMDSVTRLGYLMGCDWTLSWDKWGRSQTTVCQDQVAEVVDRMSQYLRYLMRDIRI